MSKLCLSNGCTSCLHSRREPALSKRLLKSVWGTYRVSAESTAQAIRIAAAYRKQGWLASSRGKRIVLTALEPAYLDADTPVTIWQVDRASHEAACKQFLIPELRGQRRPTGEVPIVKPDKK